MILSGTPLLASETRELLYRLGRAFPRLMLARELAARTWWQEPLYSIHARGGLRGLSDGAHMIWVDKEERVHVGWQLVLGASLGDGPVIPYAQAMFDLDRFSSGGTYNDG